MALCARTSLFIFRLQTFFFLVPVDVEVEVGVWELRECSPDSGTGLRCVELPTDAGAFLFSAGCCLEVMLSHGSARLVVIAFICFTLESTLCTVWRLEAVGAI